MRGLEITYAANKLARPLGMESFKASDGWLRRFRNHHGIGNKSNVVNPLVLTLVMLNLSN